MSRASLVVSVSLVFLAFALSGCSGGKGPERKTGSVSGAVTLDGAPVTAGVVKFSAAKSGNAALAPLDGEGNYRIEDLIADTYSVTIDPPEPVPGEPGAPQAKPPVEIPARYREARTSTFQAEVKPGSNTFYFKMTK